jgi:hypothetical protein
MSNSPWAHSSEVNIIHEIEVMANDYMEHCIMNYSSSPRQVKFYTRLKEFAEELRIISE